jgi:hypothetical protein
MRINHGAGPEGATSSTRSIKTRSQIENTLISRLSRRTLTRFHHIQLRKKPIFSLLGTRCRACRFYGSFSAIKISRFRQSTPASSSSRRVWRNLRARRSAAIPVTRFTLLIAILLCRAENRAAWDFYLRGATPATIDDESVEREVSHSTSQLEPRFSSRWPERKRHFVLSGVSSTWCRARDDDKSCNYILKVNCTNTMFGVSRANWMRSSRRRFAWSSRFFFVCQQRFLMARLPAYEASVES